MLQWLGFNWWPVMVPQGGVVHALAEASLGLWEHCCMTSLRSSLCCCTRVWVMPRCVAGSPGVQRSWKKWLRVNSSMVGWKEESLRGSFVRRLQAWLLLSSLWSTGGVLYSLAAPPLLGTAHCCSRPGKMRLVSKGDCWWLLLCLAEEKISKQCFIVNCFLNFLQRPKQGFSGDGSSHPVAILLFSSAWCVTLQSAQLTWFLHACSVNSPVMQPGFWFELGLLPWAGISAHVPLLQASGLPLVELLWRDAEQHPELLLRTCIQGSISSLNVDRTSLLSSSAVASAGKAVPWTEWKARASMDPQEHQCLGQLLGLAAVSGAWAAVLRACWRTASGLRGVETGSMWLLQPAKGSFVFQSLRAPLG